MRFLVPSSFIIMEKSTISIIGLGKLGAPMVAAFASRGHKVIGVDINLEVVNLINQGKSLVFEPHLDEYLKQYKENISATSDYKEAILQSDVTFVIVATPSEVGGGFSNKYLIEVAKSIGEVLAQKSTYHLVVFRSTVIPGSHDAEILPVLEKFSGKKIGTDFGVCFNPEFLALGAVIKNILNPDFVLIGQYDQKSGQLLEDFYRGILKNDAPIKRMNMVNAEIAKIALNTYVTTKISFSNMLAELCEKMPGGNIDEVTNTLGIDKRIGLKYLKGALGYGGTCFPRDNGALMFTAKKFGLSMPLAQATEEINVRQVPRMVEKIISVLPLGGKIGFLGLSFKPDTAVVEKSQSLEIAELLAKKGVSVMAYDPKAMDEAKKVLGNSISYAKSLKECLEFGNVIVIATDWQEFKTIQPSDVKEGSVIVDCWRILDAKAFSDKVKYIPLGVNI